MSIASHPVVFDVYAQPSEIVDESVKWYFFDLQWQKVRAEQSNANS